MSDDTASVLYKTIPLQACRSLVEERRSGEEPDIGSVVLEKGAGRALNMDEIAAAADALSDLREDVGPTKRDPIEGRAAIHLYEAVHEVPSIVLNDPGFWRYLSLGQLGLWEFAAWRHGEQLHEDAFMKYVDAKDPKMCVLTRMYLRIRALHGGESENEEYRELAAAIEVDAADFWRSHIIRVRVGKAPAIARAFARIQRDRPLKTKDVRRLARLLNRIHSNVFTAIYNDEEAEDFILDLRDEVDPPSSGS